MTDQKTPFLTADESGYALFAEDGSVIRKGPDAPLPPLSVALPPEVPYLVNGSGSPYGVTEGGQIWPLVVTASGKPLLGPGFSPVLAKTYPESMNRGAARALIFADDTPLCLSTDGSPLGVIPLVSERLPSGAIIAHEYVDLHNGQTLRGPDGNLLALDPDTLYLLSHSGKPLFNPNGQRQQAGPQGPPVLERVKGFAGGLATAPTPVKVNAGLAAAAAVLLLLLVGCLGPAVSPESYGLAKGGACGSGGGREVCEVPGMERGLTSSAALMIARGSPGLQVSCRGCTAPLSASAISNSKCSAYTMARRL